MNFSISEIMMIVLVALLVIKPDQLPDAAFNLGKFAKSIRRLFAKVKEEMNGFVDAVEEIPSKRREPSSKQAPETSSVSMDSPVKGRSDIALIESMEIITQLPEQKSEKQ